MAGLPDALGFMIYAGFLDPIHQAGRVMWEAVTDRGLEVPGDVAIACFDQLPSGLRFSDAIATVEQPAYDIGGAAVAMLLRRIAGDDAPISELRLLPTLHEPLGEATTARHDPRLVRRETAP